MVDERSRRGAGSRERILEAALRVAALRGYDGTTVQRISEESGLPPSSLYWHFGSKDRLLAAALQQGYATWGQALARREPPGTGFEEAVRRRVRSGLRAVAETPAAWRLGLMLSLQTSPQDEEARQAFLDVHRRAVDSMAEWWLALLPPEVAEPALARRLSASFLAFLDGLYVAHSSAPEWELDALADDFARGVVAHVRRLQAAT